MLCTFYVNVCSIGESFCKAQGEEAEKNCPEAAKFRLIEKSPCPIMVSYGYDDRLCKCDLPLWLRATIDVACVVENQCIVAVYFPKVRGMACDRNLKPEEIAGLRSKIKTDLKKITLDQPAPTTA